MNDTAEKKAARKVTSDERNAIHAEMVRVVRDMQARLDEAGLLDKAIGNRSENALSALLAISPQAVRDDVYQG
jgi:hypothetical protein